MIISFEDQVTYELLNYLDIKQKNTEKVFKISEFRFRVLELHNFNVR